MTTMDHLRMLAALGLLACAATAARAQVIERETTITGPRGNSVTRDIRSARVGNMIDRQVTIRRPGATITRETEVFAPRGGGGFYGPRTFVEGGYVGPVFGGPAFIGPGFFGPGFFGPSIGFGLPAVNLFVGGGAPAPPPLTVYNPPVPYPLSTAAAEGSTAGPAPPRPVPAPGQPTVVVDPVAESIGKLDSFHSHVRREAAIALGKFGDARGVPPLINKLEHDFDKEVRMAAAWALAEVGDPRAIVPLETARQFDKRADVRAVATKSLDRMPREVARRAPSRAREAESEFGYPARRAPDGEITSTPARSNASESPPAAASPLDDLPPPDPTPVDRPSSAVPR